MIRVKQTYVKAILLLALVSMISFLFSVSMEDDTGVIIICTLSITGIVLILFNGLPMSGVTWGIIISSWVLRVIAIPIDMQYGISRQPDQYGFFHNAELIATNQLDPTANVNLYSKWMAPILNIFGVSDYIVRLLNAFICMVGIFFTLKAISLFKVSKRNYYICISLLALSPFTILFSICTLREATYFFLVSLSMYLFILWIRKGEILFYILSVASTVPAFMLHSGYICVATVYIIVFLFSRIGKKEKRRIIKLVFVVLGVILLPIIIKSGYMGHFSILLSGNGIETGLIGYIKSSNGANVSLGGSSYLEWTVNVSSIWQIIEYTPLRMVYFLFSPMVWDIRGIGDVFAVCTDSLIFIALIVLIVKSRINGRHLEYKTKIIFITGILIIVLASILFGWGTITAGTAIRHRNFLIPVLSIMYATVCEEACEIRMGSCVATRKSKE